MKLEGFPVHHTLRDESEVSIRPTGAEDGPALLSFFRSLPEQDRLYLRDDVTKEEFIKRFLTRLDGESVVSLVAEHQGQIVGEGTLYHDQRGWMSHVGQIRLVVARPFQKKGLGTELARELVRVATGKGLDKMVAQVAAGQAGAKRAFEKLGFHQEAVLKKHVKDLRGRHGDLIVMSNDVTHLWEALEAVSGDHPPHMDSTE